MAKNHVWHGFSLVAGVLIDFSCQKYLGKDNYMAVLPQNKKCYIILIAPRVPKIATVIIVKKHVWHGFRLILGVLIDLSCQKYRKNIIHGCIASNKL